MQATVFSTPFKKNLEVGGRQNSAVDLRAGVVCEKGMAERSGQDENEVSRSPKESRRFLFRGLREEAESFDVIRIPKNGHTTLLCSSEKYSVNSSRCLPLDRFEGPEGMAISEQPTVVHRHINRRGKDDERRNFANVFVQIRDEVRPFNHQRGPFAIRPVDTAQNCRPQSLSLQQKCLKGVRPCK
jgi:hypothetical protein